MSVASGCHIDELAARPVFRDACGNVFSELDFPPASSEITLPLRVAYGLLVTDAVRVNCELVGPMAIDTGAGWTCLSHQTAERLGVTLREPWRREKRDKPPDGMYEIDSVEVGPIALRHHLIGVIDLASVSRPSTTRAAATPTTTATTAPSKPVPLAGVIGADVWGAVPFTIDYQRNSLTLYSRETFKPPPGVHGFRLSKIRPLTKGVYIDANPSAARPLVDGRIDDIRAKIMLDTAFGGSVVLMPGFAKAHPNLADPNRKVVARVTGAAGERGLAGRELRRTRVDHVDTLGARFMGAGTATVLASVPHSANADNDCAGIIGLSYLMHGRLTFDYATGRIWPEWREPLPGATPLAPQQDDTK